MLMKEPLEPQSAMVSGALDLCRAVREALPAFSRMAESSLRISASRVSSSECPA